MTGADSPVIADSSTEAMPSITVPSPGITSPASTTTTSPRCSCGRGDLAAVGQPRRGLGAHRAQRRGLRAAAALGQRLGQVGEDDGQPQPDRDREREPARVAASRRRSQAIVVISAPTSTTNMTGLRTCTRGSSFLNEAPIAGHRISGVNRDFERARRRRRRGSGSWRWRSSVQCLVELGGVDAGLAEQAEEAAVGVVVDELLDAVEREAAHARDAARLDRARCASEMCGSTPEPDVVTASAGPARSSGRGCTAVEREVGRELVAVEVRARSPEFGPRLEKKVPFGVVVGLRRARLEVARVALGVACAIRFGLPSALAPNATCEIPVIDERIDDARAGP